MRRLARTVLALLAIATVAFGRDTPISGGRLVSDLNANGFAITNLPSGFFPTETDPTVPEWAKSPTPPASGLSTNDVCAIVTNEVPSDGFTEWSFSGFPDGTTNISASFENGILEVRFNFDGVAFYGLFSYIRDETSVELQCDDYDATVTYIITATRTRLTRNALGLARLVDLPPLTNGFVTAEITNGCLPKTGGTIHDPSTLSANLKLTDDAEGMGSLIDFDADIDATLSMSATSGKTKVSLGGNGGTGVIVELYNNGEDAVLNVGTMGDANTKAVVNIGTNGTPSALTVGGTNVMNYVAQTGADAQTYADTEVLAASQSNTNYTETVARDATNYTDTAIANADTTYKRFAIAAPTNINQSVQYINIAAAEPSVLSVLLPEGDGTKDWLIYVMSQTNVTISLPSATWWLADTSATNDIAPQTPTALYFSQAADGIYTLGRQEFTEVALP